MTRPVLLVVLGDNIGVGVLSVLRIRPVCLFVPSAMALTGNAPPAEGISTSKSIRLPTPIGKELSTIGSMFSPSTAIKVADSFPVSILKLVEEDALMIRNLTFLEG